ncbi:MAG TPA: 4,5-dihydroxyphthalate decarboxylase, partial [Rhodospirillaceae bacterium]|nr:4,5-dihydroxyphthalate decarboxylase [Rhodospirillaceae bacterium]
AGRPEKLKIDLPAEVKLEQAPEGATLNQMLAEGEIDAFVGPRWPRSFNEG